jgi:hypothetical protein
MEMEGGHHLQEEIHPLWYNDLLISHIPDEFLPEWKRKQLRQQGGGQRRRSSAFVTVSAASLEALEALEAEPAEAEGEEALYLPAQNKQTVFVYSQLPLILALNNIVSWCLTCNLHY